jgi:hypothetical protein
VIQGYVEVDYLNHVVPLVANTALAALLELARFALEHCRPAAHLALEISRLSYLLQFLYVRRTLHAISL